MDHLPLWGRRRGFSLSSSVSSSITRLGVIFVFASLFPTLFLLIAAVFMINYGLECFANLGIAYIYHSTHQLFKYKLCVGKFWIWGSKHSQVFYTLNEFSNIFLIIIGLINIISFFFHTMHNISPRDKVFPQPKLDELSPNYDMSTSRSETCPCLTETQIQK